MVRSESAMSDKDGNWLKLVSELRLTGEGIEKIVKEVSEEVAEKIINEARKAAGLYGKEVCGQCTTHNAVSCRSGNGLCHYDEERNCTYHDRADPLKESKPCPHGICDKIPKIIKRYHRFHSPNYKNTDASKWFENPLEIAKCFISTDGYENITNEEETDTAGLLAIVINCKTFESRVATNLGSPDNSFAKLRKVRNKILHASGLNISDDDFQAYTQLMLDVLEDEKLLAHDSEAKDAAEKIREIAESLVHVFCGEEILEQTIESNESKEKPVSSDQEDMTEWSKIRSRTFSDEESIDLVAWYGVNGRRIFLERKLNDKRTSFEELHTKTTDQLTDRSQDAVNSTSAVNTNKPKPTIVIVFAQKKTSGIQPSDMTSC